MFMLEGALDGELKQKTLPLWSGPIFSFGTYMAISLFLREFLGFRLNYEIFNWREIHFEQAVDVSDVKAATTKRIWVLMNVIELWPENCK